MLGKIDILEKVAGCLNEMIKGNSEKRFGVYLDLYQKKVVVSSILHKRYQLEILMYAAGQIRDYL